VHHDEEVEDFSGLSLQFRTGDLDTFLVGIPANVCARGPVERPWGSRYACLTDPNGIGLIVYEGRV
jgi:uncharacterized glyoxalase superfamily protein PhnB